MNLAHIVEPIRRITWPPPDQATDPEALVRREWLVANGLGGYASGTVSGVITRRYHGLLIAALPVPLGRVVMLSQLVEQVRLPDGRRVTIDGTTHLEEFRLEAGLPIWRYRIEGVRIEKRVFLTHMQNTVHVLYELVDSPPDVDHISLALRPSVHFRPQEAPVSEPLKGPYEFRANGDCYEIRLKGSRLPPLRLRVHATRPSFTLREKRTANVLYVVEESRGYQGRGDLWSPGYYTFSLAAGQRAALMASTESCETMEILEPGDALRLERERRHQLIGQAPANVQTGVAAELVLAADQFIITPAGRTEEAMRARASGDEVRSVIAGYHWFTDWGRDTMISLEGLSLVTGRSVEAGYILRTFAHYVRDGLIPNMFPEREKEGLYHTADASLWFFHAVDRYLDWSGDPMMLPALYPTLKSIIDAHIHGTRFGIGMDAKDGLLAEGAPGYQLTWMDAKVDDWVVTPRRGKPVEINALWYNALRLMERWSSALMPTGDRDYKCLADRVKSSFNERFWYEHGGYLYDVVDTEEGGPGSVDSRCRPNQIFAVSLPHPVLVESRWEPVVRTVSVRLLTPVGLRSLAPGDPDFKPRYFGDLRTRDAAYHQGTVWGWLVGPFVDAWLKVHPHDLNGAQRTIEGFVAHLDDACIGSISEVFDADAPFTPRGCVAQAWSVAEVMRVFSKVSALREKAR